MNQIAIYGAGSYAQEVACLIHKINNRVSNKEQLWNFVGYFDDDMSLWGKSLLCGEVLGGIQNLNNVRCDKLALVICIASVKAIRIVHSKIENKSIYFPNIVDPDTSWTSIESVELGVGNIIGEGCRIGPYVRMGNFNIVVNDSVFGHDVEIGDYNVFFPAVRLSGKVKVGNDNTFGVRTTILPGVNTSSANKFAPGCFLHSDAESGFVYLGNPARKMLRSN